MLTIRIQKKFKNEMPKKSNGSTALTISPEQSRRTKNGGSVLLVDNDRDMCQVISDVLKQAGIKVNIAFNGESALAKAKKHRYDLMLLDYKLPGISGLTVLEKIHQIKPNLKTIMISAFGNESTKARAKELGAYAFLDKPFNIDGLVKVVKKALNGNGKKGGKG